MVWVMLLLYFTEDFLCLSSEGVFYYSSVMSSLRCKISYSLLHCAIMCLREANKWPCGLLKFISINIIAAICWPLPLISQLFSPRFF